MNEALLTTIYDNFHFLRPAWLYALIPALLLFILLRFRQSHHSNWSKAVDAHLLQHILDNPGKAASRSPLTLLLASWVLAVIALAGPAWQKTPQPVHEREDALVVILDLSKSMLATDVKPDRLVRAKRKLHDLLTLREEGVTGLVVFAGDAHIVSPLTDDANTIAAIIPVLTPDILPAPGSQLAPALQKARELFRNGGVTSGKILVITDEIRDLVAAQQVARQFRHTYPVSVMSVGTAKGAPVASNQPAQGYLRDSSGNLVIPRLDTESLADFAALVGGRYSPMTLTEEDLAYLLADQPIIGDERFRELERDFDVWVEEGPWLFLLLLPLAALAFRRGWIWSLVLLVMLPHEHALALDWEDLWKTPDQQGISALTRGDAAGAAELFKHPVWKATANYRSENYAEAASLFGGIQTTDGRYNLGNTFTRQHRFNEAIEAYQQALTLDPDNEDALFNKKLIEALLAQQQQQQQNQQGQEGDNPEEGQQENQQDQEKQDQQEQKEQQNQQDQEKQEKQDQQEQQSQQDEQEEQKEQEEQAPQQVSEEEANPLDEEEKQALQQWLRRVPDDPGGLLRRKFQWQYEERIREGKVQQDDAKADW